MHALRNAFPCALQTEGMALARAADLPADKLLAVLDQGAMANPLFKMKVGGPCTA